MHLTKKIQIKLSANPLRLLWSVSSLCTQVYNAALEQRRDRNSFGKVNVFTQKRELTDIKKEMPEFKAPSSQVLQNALFALDRGYKMFFTKLKQGDKQARPPKFRSQRYFFTQEYSQPGVSFDVGTPGKLRLAYGKNRKDWIEIDIPEGGYDNVKTVKIIQDKTSKKFYACLTYEIQTEDVKESGPVLYLTQAVRRR